MLCLSLWCSAVSLWNINAHCVVSGWMLWPQTFALKQSLHFSCFKSKLWLLPAVGRDGRNVRWTTGPICFALLAFMSVLACLSLKRQHVNLNQWFFHLTHTYCVSSHIGDYFSLCEGSSDLFHDVGDMSVDSALSLSKTHTHTLFPTVVLGMCVYSEVGST